MRNCPAMDDGTIMNAKTMPSRESTSTLTQEKPLILALSILVTTP